MGGPSFFRKSGMFEASNPMSFRFEGRGLSLLPTLLSKTQKPMRETTFSNVHLSYIEGILM